MELRYTVNKELKSIARINNASKVIEVSPRFEKYDKESMELILLQLTFLTEHGDPYKADDQTFDKLQELYPDRQHLYWYEKFMRIMFNEFKYGSEVLEELIISRMDNATIYRFSKT